MNGSKLRLNALIIGKCSEHNIRGFPGRAKRQSRAAPKTPLTVLSLKTTAPKVPFNGFRGGVKILFFPFIRKDFFPGT
jgi:hypothetical protein